MSSISVRIKSPFRRSPKSDAERAWSICSPASGAIRSRASRAASRLSSPGSMTQIEPSSSPPALTARASLDFSHVVKATVHLHHPGRDFAGFNASYEEFVEAPYPARTTVGSFLGDFLVEIDVVAAIA